MPRHPKVTDDQRFAIAFAVLDDKLTVPEAVQAAALGELGPAFTVSTSAADKIVAEERERRQPLSQIVENVARDLLQICDRELGRLRALPALGPDEVRALRDLTEMAEQATSLIGEAAWLADSDEDERTPLELAARRGARACGAAA
ncbi:MAG TPA: hypothetical protein VMY78_16610 [Solirubrobacteraceae bacterium]|nr:hypothetical protein [Solirubrobacteraceae bacterium]